ncbi:hypothetical protein UAY_00327 [Enterococcus moraviensis ATCC BAA-383]|uniref:N-acetyltransferase domain-containing protein n=1 Tax=Enterococcus moraviensis ATCC BAA-383 TaxID=1158609 RepID=R2RDB9_9ENTE|nr:GNAT family N-acetyltransferase [Enterococcus moraviensis]EOI06985.1 hypothetical protein UAY_00327 [Enterococcus moraviensis ATCC BAA-383]EOT65327.1 hypothetical protein I586_03061 [Enterococcus moraviensis ATCC BAA-383]OJG66786.1 hypothetical protein RV09_GL003255 [Enterococcus moraviensis]
MFTTIEEANFQQVVDTWNQGFSDYLLPINVDQKGLEQRIQSLKLSKKLSVLYSINGEFAGIILLGVQTFRNIKVMWVGGMAVVPKYRQNKVASKLMNYAEQMAKEHHCEHLLLEVLEANERAKHLYQTKGFQTINELVVGEVVLPPTTNKKSKIHFQPIAPKEQVVNENKWTPWQNRCIFSDKNYTIYQESAKIGSISFNVVDESSSKNLILKQLHLFEQRDVFLVENILTTLKEQENSDSIKVTNFDKETSEYAVLEKIGMSIQLTQFQLAKKIVQS